MKKIMCAMVGFALVMLTFGCGKAEEKTLSCTLDKKDVINGYEIHSTYTAHAKDGIVTEVKTKEVVTTETDEMAAYFKETLDNTYQKMHQSYGGYEYTVTNDNRVVTADVTIDYTKLNLEQLAKDDPTTKSLLNGKNQMTYEGIKKIYETQGATCTE